MKRIYRSFLAWSPVLVYCLSCGNHAIGNDSLSLMDLLAVPVLLLAAEKELS